MKKAFTQTIIVFVAINLITAGFALAQNAPDEASREEALAARKQAEVARVEAEIAAKVAQKEAEIAQKQMESTKKQVQTQLRNLLDAQQKQAKIFQSSPNITTTATASQVRIPAYPHSSSGTVLVIPTAEMKIENLAAITEDMNVMSRIFDKKLSQAHLASGRGSWTVNFDPFSGRDSGTTEAVYLEGYASLFLMKVNFPLVPPPKVEEKKTEEEDTDPLWTQMKQEIYAPQEADRRRRTDDRPEEKYDAEKVAELKETLIKTLKHAANIRVLKPDQSVILTVIGGRSQSGTTTTMRSYGRSSMTNISRGRSSMVRRAPRVPTVAASLLPTVLTICAKKSDIDDFAKGQLSFDQFQERIKIFTSYKLGSGGFPGVENRPVAQVQSPVF